MPSQVATIGNHGGTKPPTGKNRLCPARVGFVEECAITFPPPFISERRRPGGRELEKRTKKCVGQGTSVWKLPHRRPGPDVHGKGRGSRPALTPHTVADKCGLRPRRGVFVARTQAGSSDFAKTDRRQSPKEQPPTSSWSRLQGRVFTVSEGAGPGCSNDVAASRSSQTRRTTNAKGRRRPIGCVRGRSSRGRLRSSRATWGK